MYLLVIFFGDVRRHDSMKRRKGVKSKSDRIIIKICICDNLLKKQSFFGHNFSTLKLKKQSLLGITFQLLKLLCLAKDH